MITKRKAATRRADKRLGRDVEEWDPAQNPQIQVPRPLPPCCPWAAQPCPCTRLAAFACYRIDTSPRARSSARLARCSICVNAMLGAVAGRPIQDSVCGPPQLRCHGEKAAAGVRGIRPHQGRDSGSQHQVRLVAAPLAPLQWKWTAEVALIGCSNWSMQSLVQCRSMQYQHVGTHARSWPWWQDAVCSAPAEAESQHPAALCKYAKPTTALVGIAPPGMCRCGESSWLGALVPACLQTVRASCLTEPDEQGSERACIRQCMQFSWKSGGRGLEAALAKSAL